jgi:hypothetical protein
MSDEEIMNEAQARTGTEYQEHFKRNGKWVDDAAFLRFCKNGIKKSETLEELKELSLFPSDVYLECHLSIWYKDGRTYKDGSPQEHERTERFNNAHSSKDILSFLAKAKERIENKSPNETSIYVCMKFSYEKVIAYPKEIKKRQKRARPLNNYWVVKVIKESGETYFIRKISRTKLYFSYSHEHAKPFDTEKEAMQWTKYRKIKSRFGNINDFEYEHIA